MASDPVELTATSTSSLHTLSLNAGHVSTYSSLLRQVWRERRDSDTAPVRSSLMKLRRRIGQAAACIFNERGIGV